MSGNGGLIEEISWGIKELECFKYPYSRMTSLGKSVYPNFLLELLERTLKRSYGVFDFCLGLQR